MTYFLDFDRVLFDVEAFISVLISRPELADLAEVPYEEFKLKVGDRIAEGTLAFAPGELAHFLYPDSVVFLTTHTDAHIITRGVSLPLQKAKVMSAFSGSPPVPVLFTHVMHKGPFILQHPPADTSFSFVDDELIELDLMHEAFPAAKIYEIRRDGKEGCGRYPVIRSLTGLP